MRIVFFPESTVAFHGNSLDVRPLGGTETAVIRLAQALSERGHEVFVFSDFDNPPVSHPLYVSKASLHLIKETDIFVGVRDWRGMFVDLKRKKSFFWTGDASDQPITYGLGDKRVIQKTDAFLCVSSWHAQQFKEFLPVEKVSLQRNGVHLPFFEIPRRKKNKSLMYSSTPYRGLIHLPRIFSEILKRHPDSSLSVFSGYHVYSPHKNLSPEQVTEMKSIEEGFKGIPNVSFVGNVPQAELSKAFLEHEILAYPNTFAETSCITVMEAQAGSAIPVTSSYGALSETIGDAGIVIQGIPGEEEFAQRFVNEVDRIFSDEIYKETLQKKCKQAALANSWSLRADEFLQLC